MASPCCAQTWVVVSLVAASGGMWNLSRPGIALVSPALAGRFLTTGPPGNSSINFYWCVVALQFCISFYCEKALLISIVFLKNKTNYVTPQKNLCGFAFTFRIKSTFSWWYREDSLQLSAYHCTSSDLCLLALALWELQPQGVPHIPRHGSPLPHLPVFSLEPFYLANSSFFRASSRMTSEMLF